MKTFRTLVWVFALSALATPTAALGQSATLRFQIIEADGFTETDPAIADVQLVLNELFRFRGYRLAGEAVIRVGGGSFSQAVATSGGDTYSISGGQAEVTLRDAGLQAMVDNGLILRPGVQRDAVRIQDLMLFGGPRDQRPEAVLSTSLTLPTGQTVVVGSARPSSEGPTIILVVRALPN